MLRRLCVALVLGILVTAAVAQAAAADPSGARNSLTFPATCDGQTVQVVVNGGGTFSPAHVVGSTSVFVPQAFDLTFEFTPPGGPTQIDTNTSSKNNVHGDLVTCSLDTTQTSPDGTLRVVGTVTGFFTPAS
jgi:hypothetical protein